MSGAGAWRVLQLIEPRQQARQQQLRRIVDALAHGARGDGGARDRVDLPGLRLAAVLDHLHLVGQGGQVLRERDVQRLEVGEELAVGEDLVADARCFAHRHHADAHHALAGPVVAEHHAHRIGIALGRAFGGDAGQLAGAVVGGVEAHRAGWRVGGGGAHDLARRQRQVAGHRLGAWQHLEHRALHRQPAVGLGGVERGHVGAHHDQAADRADQRQRAQQRAGGRGTGEGGDRGAHEFFSRCFTAVPKATGWVMRSISGVAALPIRMAYITPSGRPPE
jgi:hypothetical protein